MEPRKWIVEIDSPQDLDAGIIGFTDTIVITVDSGDPGGAKSDFGTFLIDMFLEWYDDGARIEVIEPEV